MDSNEIRHIAIIPDGNRRWAKARGLPAFMGHYEGLKAVEKILLAAAKNKNISHLTIWGASIDNILKRPEDEVAHLYKVFLKAIMLTFEKISEMPEGTRLFIRGDWEKYFPEELKNKIRKINEESSNKNGYLTVTALLAYSGKGDMIRAIGKIKEFKEDITEETLVANLQTGHLPPVDLLIRTGGEPHNSDGFMMWQTADAALYFTETLWPDFSEEEFLKAIDEVEGREKRRGK